MKRFIDLGTQIMLSGDKEFSFFCTITDTFEDFNGEQTFESIADFESYYEGEELDRYLSLIPKDWNKAVNYKTEITELFEQWTEGEDYSECKGYLLYFGKYIIEHNIVDVEQFCLDYLNQRYKGIEITKDSDSFINSLDFAKKLLTQFTQKDK